jgi:hypothetical protein
MRVVLLCPGGLSRHVVWISARTYVGVANTVGMAKVSTIASFPTNGSRGSASRTVPRQSPTLKQTGPSTDRRLKQRVIRPQLAWPVNVRRILRVVSYAVALRRRTVPPSARDSDGTSVSDIATSVSMFVQQFGQKYSRITNDGVFLSGPKG